MLKKYYFVFSVLLAAAVMFGCTDRGTGVTQLNYDYRDPFTATITQDGGHEFAYQLGHSMFSAVHSSPRLDYRIYLPPGYEDNTVNKAPLPVLYLLSPFRGSAFYYLNHGLVDIADRMIADGEIDPMFIVCIDGSSGYGGNWYGGTYAGGKYAEIVGDIHDDPITGTMIDWVESFLPTFDGRGTRGVSGIGMGGYGAVRVGIEYSENYGSLSAVSAPLDFDGASGVGGFMPLFSTIVNNLDTDFRDMDTSFADPLRTLIMAAGCAFSPHAYYDTLFFLGFANPQANDTTIFDDTLTLFAPEGSQSGIAFHLPFDENGTIPAEPIYLDWPDSSILAVDSGVTPWDTTWSFFTSYDTIGYYDSTWTLWLNNNPENMLANYPGALDADSTAVKLMALASDLYDFDQQTRDFAAFLSTVRGSTVPVEMFDGYSDFDAFGGRFLYDILPEILKFHSDQFKMNME